MEWLTVVHLMRDCEVFDGEVNDEEWVENGN